MHWLDSVASSELKKKYVPKLIEDAKENRILEPEKQTETVLYAVTRFPSIVLFPREHILGRAADLKAEAVLRISLKITDKHVPEFIKNGPWIC